MKLRSPCPWILLASICQACGSGPFLCFFGCIVRIGGWLSGVQRLVSDRSPRHRLLLSSLFSSSSRYHLVVIIVVVVVIVIISVVVVVVVIMITVCLASPHLTSISSFADRFRISLSSYVCMCVCVCVCVHVSGKISRPHSP